MAANLVDHVLCRVPCSFVGFGGIEVGAATEEQPSESDKGEGLEDGPGISQPLEGIGSRFLLENQVDKMKLTMKQKESQTEGTD